MSALGGDLAGTAARLSAMAAVLDDREWSDAAAALADGNVTPPPSGPPTYHDVALTGLALVEALADAGRWREARTQAAFVSDFFTASRRRLHAVAGVGFQGLLSAVADRDREEMVDMADFLREIFAVQDDPA